MVSPFAPGTIRKGCLHQEKWMPQQRELPPPSLSPRDPGLVLTLQLLPLPLSFTLRKAACCPFNLTHGILEEGSQELKAGR